MKLKLSILAITIALSACSSTKVSTAPTVGDITPVNAQKLTTSFKRQGVKIEWECAWGTGAFGLTDAMCVKGDIKAIEVTGYAASFGNSEALRETAFIKAKMTAQGKLSRFIQDDIKTSRVLNTISKNVEKANDQIKSKIKTDEVAISDDDVANDNVSIRANTNDTVVTLTESISSQTQSIQRGVYTLDEKIVDRQTVAVTIRWDKDSEKASQYFNRKFR
jgi:hypothetical protein